MNRLFKTLVISATLAATALVSAGTASADGWRRHYHGGDSGDALAAGVAGLAVGALLGSALSAPPSHRQYIDEPPVYGDPQPVYDDEDVGYVPAPPVYRRTVIVRQSGYYPEQPRTLRPWSRAWMRYCSQRYRSFDPGTGTFIGNDGDEHFCVAG